MENTMLLRIVPLFLNASVLFLLIYLLWRINHRKSKHREQQMQTILRQNEEMKKSIEELLSKKETGQ